MPVLLGLLLGVQASASIYLFTQGFFAMSFVGIASVLGILVVEYLR